MPKRPCAITITSDETTILCADKFGDVYSLPLLCSDSSVGPNIHEKSTETPSAVKKPSKPLVPAANDLTVHSIRNRRALQNQMKQKNIVSQKPEPQFEHKLLLGHVSMLTDITLVECNGQSYIITADRDEHIRISRGIPQTHIIAGYCLGHKDFVSRLCLPAGLPNLLISGGGDDEIYVWDWSLGKLLHKINIKSHAEKVLIGVHNSSHTDSEILKNATFPLEPFRLAVSSIHHVAEPSDRQNDFIMVTCEG
jgi:tRNA (guanine-N(7)-)-methyltransferase subunit TRM82